MGIQHKLAKMAVKSPSLKPGVGGLPEITAQDVAAALGYANGKIPRSPKIRMIGPHLVMAKYCDDSLSRKVLLSDNNLPYHAYLLWWKLKLDVSNSRSTLKKLTEVALDDFCEPGKAAGKGEVFIRRRVGIGYDLWTKVYSRFYGEFMVWMMDQEAPVLDLVIRFLKPVS